MFILVIIDKWERYIITLICAAITLISVFFGIGLHSLQAIIDTLNIKVYLNYNFGIRQENPQKLQVVSTGQPLYLLQA